MTLNPIALFACICAVLALGAEPAAGAEFHSDGSPTGISGISTAETSFVFDGGTVTCKEASYTGEQVATTASELKLVPSTSGCAGFGLSSAVIDWNGCYLVHRVTVDLGPPVRLTARVEIACPSTPLKKDEVEITVITAGLTSCIVHIPSQTIESGGTYTNGELGGIKNFAVDYSSGSLQYTQTPGEGLAKCASAAGTKNGAISGQALISGRNEKKEATSVWVE
jgi:hypothetical protein